MNNENTVAQNSTDSPSIHPIAYPKGKHPATLAALAKSRKTFQKGNQAGKQVGEKLYLTKAMTPNEIREVMFRVFELVYGVGTKKSSKKLIAFASKNPVPFLRLIASLVPNVTSVQTNQTQTNITIVHNTVDTQQDVCVGDVTVEMGTDALPTLPADSSEASQQPSAANDEGSAGGESETVSQEGGGGSMPPTPEIRGGH